MTCTGDLRSSLSFRTEVTMDQHLYPNSSPAPDPGATYTAHLDACRQEGAALQRRNLLLSYLRLLWVVAAFALAWFLFGRSAPHWLWLLLPVAGFGVTASFHDRILRAVERSRRAVTWYEEGLARVEDRWAGMRPRPVPPAAAESLFAVDLDLFGPGSVFELLCTVRSRLGEDTLARWLLDPASVEEVAARQQAVRELREHLLLRQRIASANGPPTVQLHATTLTAWGEAKTATVPSFVRWLAPALAVFTVGAAVRWALGHSPVLLSLALLVNGAITFSMRSRFQSLFEETEQIARPLHLLAELLVILEGETFTAERLRSAQACFGVQPGVPGKRASEAVHQLARLAGAVEQRANFIARLLDFGVLYSVQLALLLQTWRSRYGTQLRPWFGALGDLEALLALSTYHFEHPQDAFPELVSHAVFEARGLGHPLLAENECVRNDLSLNAGTRLLIISGSNMSGKSTLMRATGVACVMAGAGAPVRARALRLSSFRLGASIQVQDSLQGGRSRFYAEILRLRAICELAGQESTVLFLLDELLAGTNSQDRLVGATGVVETLLRAGAMGLLSTHDLALTELHTELPSSVRNAHLEDRIVEGKLQFDYTLREGILTRSNGLDLMRLIGLEV